MMESFRTPGVYAQYGEAVSVPEPGLVRSDIVGFIGIAQRGPIARPVRIESWNDFFRTFGRETEQGYLADAVHGFFENGGTTCWVVRVADKNSSVPAGLTLINAQGRGVARIYAKSPGAWGGGIRIDFSHRGAERFDLSVYYEGDQYENWHGLSLQPTDTHFLPRVLARWSTLINASVWHSFREVAKAQADIHADGGSGEGSGTTRPNPLTTVFPQDEILVAGLETGSIHHGASDLAERYSYLQGGTDGLSPTAIVRAEAASGVVYGATRSGQVTYGASLGGLYAGIPALEVRPAETGDSPNDEDIVEFEIVPVSENDNEFKIVAISANGCVCAVGATGQSTWEADPADEESMSSARDNAKAAAANLSMTEDASNFVETVVARDANVSSKIRVRRLWRWPSRKGKLVAQSYRLDGGLTPAHFAPINHTDGALHIGSAPSAIELLENIWEISLIAAPDLMPKPRFEYSKRPVHCSQLDTNPLAGEEPKGGLPRKFRAADIKKAQQSILMHCQKQRFRFAILDAPPPERLEFRSWYFDEGIGGQPAAVGTSNESAADVDHVVNWRSSFQGPVSSFGGLYYPWIFRTTEDSDSRPVRAVPPSGHVAGVFARTVKKAGIHKAPANEIVEGVQALSRNVPHVVQGHLNQKHINVLSAQRGRGIKIMGARTLVAEGSFDDPVEAAEARRWRFINVRRLVSTVEKSIVVQTQWTTFEPNSPDLWRSIDRIARAILSGMWNRGMLDGETAEQAFFVRCDATTNRPETVALGQVICEIGLMPPWPAEFVLLRLIKSTSETEAVASMELAG